jgi:hypothetical protein
MTGTGAGCTGAGAAGPGAGAGEVSGAGAVAAGAVLQAAMKTAIAMGNRGVFVVVNMDARSSLQSIEIAWSIPDLAG